MGSTAMPIDGSALPNEEYFDDASADELDLRQGADDDDDQNEAPNQDELAIRRALQPIQGGGELLEEPKVQKIFRQLHEEVLRHERLAKNRDEAAKHYEALRAGSQFSILEKSEDLSIYRQIFPPGQEGGPTSPVPNKIQDLCDKVINQILVDPPLPKPVVTDPDDDKARGAADIMRRALRENGTPSNCNDLGMLREVLNLNITQRSAFVYAWVDPTWGGWRPKRIRAHPQAVDPKNPMVGPDGQKTEDPTMRYVAHSEQNIPGAEPHPVTGEIPTMQAEVFTENPAEADREWIPKMRRRILFASQVRTFPKHAPVSQAQKVTVLMWDTLDEAKRMFPILTTLRDAQLKKLCTWRPKRWKSLVPDLIRPKGGDEASGKLSGDTILFWYHQFMRVGDEYQDGGEIAIAGPAESPTLLRRDTLREDVEMDDGTSMPVLMDIPVAQFPALMSAAKGDPFGEAPVDKFAGTNDIYAHLWMGLLEGLERGVRPNMFVTSTSPVQREDVNRRDGRPIEVFSKDDMPTWEQPPQIPGFLPKALEMIEVVMNSAAGTNETSNNLDSKYATSGVAKNVAIRQAKVSLAQYWQNTASGLVQLWRIYAQLMQARYTVAVQTMMSGSSQSYKQRWWIGADTIGIDQIAIDTGSFTMMAPGEKASLLSVMQQNAWMTPDEAMEVARSAMMDELGLPANAHEEHVDRQIADWMEGPPSTYDADVAANQAAQQQYSQMVAQAQQQGVDPQQVPKPQLKPIANPFAPRPNDQVPEVAAIRFKRLSRTMSTPEYGKSTGAWRACYDQALEIARKAGGIVTIAEQQQAAQAAAQDSPPGYQKFIADIVNKVVAAAESEVAKEISGTAGPAVAEQTTAGDQAGVAKVAADLSKGAADRQHEASENAKDRHHDMVMADVKHQHASTQAAQSAALKPPPAQAPMGAGAVAPTVPGMGIVPNK